MEQVLTNPQDVLDTFPDVASHIADGGRVPISVTLQLILEKLDTVTKTYEHHADFVDTVLKAFSKFDDLRSRSLVLQDGTRDAEDLVPELARGTHDVADKYIRHELGRFLLEYQRGKHPDPWCMIADQPKKPKDGSNSGSDTEKRPV